MVDSKKRQTLKGMAVVAGATAMGSLPNLVSANALSEKQTQATAATGSVRQVWPPLKTNSSLDVTTRITKSTNELEVVLTNKEDHSITMSQISPALENQTEQSLRMSTSLTSKPVHLAGGESFTLPMKAKSDNVIAKSSTIRSGLSVTTDANPFSAVSYAIIA